MRERTAPRRFGRPSGLGWALVVLLCFLALHVGGAPGPTVTGHERDGTGQHDIVVTHDDQVHDLPSGLPSHPGCGHGELHSHGDDLCVGLPRQDPGLDGLDRAPETGSWSGDWPQTGPASAPVLSDQRSRWRVPYGPRLLTQVCVLRV